MIVTDATNLPRLMQCTGSRLLPAVLPQEVDPTDRDEGNAAHAMAVAAFNGTPLSDMINKRAYNTFVMNAEMADFVGRYLSALDWCGSMEAVTTWGTDDFTINGRADHIAFDPHTNTLFVDDFKYGYRLVEPDENWTLLSHAIGYCVNNNIAPTTIALSIHQPRAYHSDGPKRSWAIGYEQLLGYWQRIVTRLSQPSDMLETGPSCAHCHALPTCPAARTASMNAIDASSLPYNDAMTAEQLSSELDLLRHADSVISKRKEAIEELIKHRVKSGEVFPNYALEQQFAHTKWRKGVDAAALQVLFGVDCATKPGVVTPAEAKRRGVPGDLIGAFIERPVTGTKLVRADADERARKLLGK